MGVFEDIVDKARDVADVATKKTGDVVEKSKLKLRIMRIQTEIKDKFIELGKAYYQMQKHKYQNQLVIDSLVSDIKELYEQLEANYNRLAEVYNVLICNCCSAKNPEDALYCSHCGNKLVNTFEGYDDIVDDIEDQIDQEEAEIAYAQEVFKKEITDQQVLNKTDEDKKADKKKKATTKNASDTVAADLKPVEDKKEDTKK